MGNKAWGEVNMTAGEQINVGSSNGVILHQKLNQQNTNILEILEMDSGSTFEVLWSPM